MVILKRSFYKRNPVIVAQELLGTLLVRMQGKTKLVGIIVETEAYMYGDPASHCYHTKTERNKALFGDPGHAYIYQVHTHDCFNVVAHGPQERAGGVLIRAVQPMAGIAIMQKRRGIEKLTALTNGPGKLAHAFAITKKEFYGLDLTHKGPVYIAKSPKSEPFSIVAAKRIGISKAQEKLWRFYIADNEFVSRKK